jgi:3-deoxy-D-manno-octulosonic-acid transferase
MWMYNLVIRCYVLLIRLSAFRNPKAKQWVEGRKEWRKKLQTQLLALGNSERVWMHCASYGEFEQGRPLLEAIRKQHPEYKIVLSFFSPSGYEPFKTWSGADVVTYLPFDSVSNARDFVDMVNAKQVVFIKYEFWLNFLNALKKRSTPSFLVSAIFKPHHPFFRWYGGIFSKSLLTFKTIFVQDTLSHQLLQKIGINNAIISGDTRFDRVLQIRSDFNPIPFFENYASGSQVIVAGSTWARDEVFLVQAFNALKLPNLKLILVPHEVDKKSINETETRLKENGIKYSLYTEVKDKAEAGMESVLVLDTMGLLSRIYHYADVGYVGGGFDSGIHNLLEPAVHLKPVVFCGQVGYDKYNEALELIEIGAAKAVVETPQLSKVIKDYLFSEEKVKLQNAIKTYFHSRSGSSQKVLDLMFGKD